MFERFLTIINTKALIKSSDKVLLAVSGGLDSMVMLHLFEQTDFKFGICHVNYGLRDEASDADEKLVRDTAANKNINSHWLKVDKKEWAEGGSVQMRAREIRFDFFQKVMEKEGYTKVCTAHHLNDSIETALLNLTKGTGLAGLRGIPKERDNFVRPLLSFTKDQLLDYAKDNDLVWREDVSNATNKYQRNLLRNEVIPLLKKINPNLENTFLQTFEIISGAYDSLQDQVKEIKEEYLFIHTENIDLELEWFKNDARSSALLFEILKPYQINSSVFTDLKNAILAKSIGKVFLTTSHQLLLDRSSLVIAHAIDELFEQKEIFLDDQNISIASGRLLLQKTGADVEIVKSSEMAFIDIEKLKFPLTIRSWMSGDWFIPLGMKGRKLLSDFMIDLKIPLTLKRNIRVITSGSDIVWVVGHRIDDRYKITESTTEVLIMKYETI